MSRMIQSAAIALLAVFFCIAPMLACKSAKMDPSRQVAYDAAIDRGDYEEAERIQGEANESQAYSVIDLALSLVPGLPPAVKGAIATAGATATLGLFSKRRREHYGKAIMAGAGALKHTIPLPGMFSPRLAVEKAGHAILSTGASMGYAHTNQTLEELEAVAAKMRAKASLKESKNDLA